MIKHFIFLLIYIVAYNIFSAEVLLTFLIIHSIIGIYTDVITNTISLLTLIYCGIILGSYADIALLLKVHSGGHTIYDYIVPQYIPEATLLWCIGNTAILIGYELFRKKSLPSVAFEISDKFMKNIFLFILVFNVLSLAGHNLNFNFLGGGGIKFIGLLNLTSILIFARLWKKQNNNTYRTYALSLFFLQTYIALTTAYLRQELLFPGLSLMGGYFLGLGNIKYLLTYRILPYLIGIIIFISVFKDLQRSNFIGIFNKQESPIQMSSNIENEEDKTDQDKGTFLDRIASLAQITNCVKLVRINGFYYGKASEPLLTAIIPRFLWPDKPQIRLGAWFAIAIGTAYVDENGLINNSVNMTIPGELFIDFGWIGVAAGCLLFGGMLALFWNAAHFTSSAYNITGTMWGGYLLQTGLGGFAAGDLQLVITFLSTYLIFYVVKLLFPSKDAARKLNKIKKAVAIKKPS